MSLDNNNFTQDNFEQQRRRKADNFHLNIRDNYDDEGENGYSESDELNSYSGQDVKDKIARQSKNALKKKKKAEKKELKAKNKHNRRYFRWFWVISVVIVGAMLSVFLITGMNDLLAINRIDSSKVKIEIPENPTLDDVAATLEKNGIINEPSYFKMFATITKSSDDFTQGTYEISKNMDYEAIVNYLQSMSNRTDIIKITVPEGMNVREIAAMLYKKDVISNTKEFLKLCNSDYFDEDYEFIKNIKNADKRYYKLEGYLFPDTYECYHNEDPKLTITRMLNDYEERIYENQNVEGYEKAVNVKKLSKESKYSLQQILTMASIIQAEAANEDDMYIISSVLHNRLEADINVGVRKLSLDSTKYYPFRSKKKIPKASRKTFKSKYNTYKITGLPPGPICNPGMNAIMAAIYPEDTSYLYFCHAKNGTPYYASTLYEQNLNLQRAKGN